MTKGKDLKVGQEVYRAATDFNYDKPRTPVLAIAKVLKVTPKTLKLEAVGYPSNAGFGYRTMFNVDGDYYTDKHECVQDAVDAALDAIADAQRLHREWTRILVNLK